MKKIYGTLIGTALTSIGVLLLKSSHIASGGTAGLALSASYLFDMSFSQLFFIINIPFYIFAYFQLGPRFTVSTIISVSLLSFFTDLGRFLPEYSAPIWAGTIIGGTIIGFGLSTLFLNGSSLGGFNILTLFLQKRFHIDPGKSTIAFDLLVLSTGFYAVGLIKGIFSVLTVIIIGTVISLRKNSSCSSAATAGCSHSSAARESAAGSTA